MSAALEIRDLRVAYHGVEALRGINLHVQPGEIVGLIGPNGAGKSTTMSAIFGLVPVVSGSIEVKGLSVVGMTPEAIVRQGIALVPEGRHIFQSMTVAENLSLGSMVGSASGKSPSVDDVLQMFPILGTYYQSPASRLSGGEQQQLAIGRALLSGPDILLLDEPSLGLAPKVVDMLFEIMGKLREDGTTILLVEQNARRTIRFADATYLLVTGEMKLSRITPAMADTVDVDSAYLGGGAVQ